MKRLIEQESCEHGEWEGHMAPDENSYLATSMCPGGSSREVTVDDMVLALHCKRAGFDPENERVQLEAKHCQECADEIAAVLGGEL